MLGKGRVGVMNGGNPDGQALSRMPIGKKQRTKKQRTKKHTNNHTSTATTNDTGDPACRRVQTITAQPRGSYRRSWARWLRLPC
jgi:hypothetical protein